MPGAGGAAFAQTVGLGGPVLHLSAGSVSGTCAIGEAVQKISAGLADVVVAGGGEAPLQADVVEDLQVAGILAPSRSGEPPCLPFDARRCGTVLGEGAGVLVLEAAEHAMRRAARPRAVVRGFGFCRENYSMIRPDPTGSGVTEASRRALGPDGPDAIGWVKTHGTGTVLNDAAECHGLAVLLGERLPCVPITSLKATLGHCLGASGAVEAVATILALEAGMIPPTLGTAAVDAALPECRVALHAERTRARRVLLLAEGFGGRCAALVIDRP